MAMSLANRAYVLQTGKIVTSGDTKKIRDIEELTKAYLSE